MRPLLIDEEAKNKIARVIQYAENNKYSRPFMLERVKGGGKCPGDLGYFTCHLQVGYRCVYTIEEQPFGWCHHLSVSVDSPTKMPNIAAVEFLMKEFGISQPMSECYVYFEENVTPKAVNILSQK